MASNIYGAIALTGGLAGALDAIDGAVLADKDVAFVIEQATGVYVYVLDADSAAAEASPRIISPDANGGDKRWILQPVTIANVAVGGTKYWGSTTSVADDGTIVLPAITANASAHGIVQVSAAGAIEQSAEFEIDSTGNVALIRGTDNVVANADTDGMLCIGTAAAQNPLTIKNRLAGAKTVLISLWYN
jgi:hypothetical protein